MHMQHTLLLQVAAMYMGAWEHLIVDEAQVG